MRFRLLGGVSGYSDGRAVDLGPARQRFVLAVLLVDANRLVSFDSLVDRVWDGRPPPSVRNTVQSYVSRLRKALAGMGEVVIAQRSGGYLLTVDPLAVDVHVFRHVVDDARAATGERALTLFEQAIGLWHGEPLAGLNTLWASEVRDGLAQEHFAAQLDLIDVALRCGHHARVLPLLCGLTAKRPTDERLAGQLMLALHRNGRQADALSLFHQVRQRLADDLGVDPSPELRLLHHQILIADPVLAVPSHRPAQLPADVASFTGRVPELDRLRHVWPRSSDNSVVCVIDGMAGVGKTALAVHAAHQIKERFPDGQLFVDLRGYAEGTEPVEPAAALDQWLRALGVAGEQIPSSVEDRAALFRTTVAGRRVLLVLDNAASVDQIRPLLPGAPACLVLVTSRQRLLELDDAVVLSLDVLPRPDAVALFASTVGQDRLAGGAPEQVAEVVELCGHLPLAIRVAAARIRGHATWSVAHLAARLRDQRFRLSELEAGRRSVTAALSVSYRHLDLELRRAYRLLGCHPGPAIDAYATAALVDTDASHAERLLEHLHNAHLLTEPTPGRYTFHDLTRAHASSQDEPEPGRATALARLLDYYTYTAAAAMDLAYPHEAQPRPRVARPATPTPDLATEEQGTRWLDTEQANLIAVAVYAAEHGWPAHCHTLSATLRRHLGVRAQYTDALRLHTHALRAARAGGDREAEATALIDLGRVHDTQDQHEPAVEYFAEALTIARDIGDRGGELAALTGLGKLWLLAGRFTEALDSVGQAVAIARDIGQRAGELAALRVLGDVHRLMGRYDWALEYLGRGLGIARDIGNRTDELWALLSIGDTYFDQGTYQHAADHYQPALAAADRTGNRLGQISALRGLGDVHRLHGTFDLAVDLLGRSLAIASDIDFRNGQFEALLSLGHTHQAAGEPRLALTHHRRALRLAHDLNQPHDQARAHEGIASAHDALDHPEHAREHWQQALTIYAHLGLPDADKIRTQLTQYAPSS